MANEERRIVVLGKTGSGKSSLGNTILESGAKFTEFTVNHSVNSGTKSCESETIEVDGRNITLIDTPGFFDTDPRSTELSRELLKCIQECAPGPHAFLLVLKVEKYTRQEQAVVDVILKYFSQEALKYTTVVFTHGDDLPDDTMIENWASENEALKSLIQRCGGRCHVFDNKRWKNSQDPYRNNQHQVQALLNTIEETVKENGGSCYTNKMLQKVAVDKGFLTKLAGVSTGILLGALLGLPVMVVSVAEFLRRGVAGGVAGGVAVGVAGGVAGAMYGGYRGYKLAEEAETPEDAAKAVWKEAKDLLLQITGKMNESKMNDKSPIKYDKLE